MKAFSIFSIVLLAFATLSCADDRSFNNPVDTNVPLDSPANVSASALADTAVQVFWTYSGPTTGFDIEQKIGTGAFNQVASVQPSAQQYVHTFALQSGQTYSYGVRTVNSSNRSSYVTTNAISVTFIAPTGVVVQAVADTAVDVSWTYTGAFQTGFEVDRQVGTGTFTKVATAGSAVRTYRDTVALIAGQSYTYRVRAISKNNQSQYATATALSPTFTAPSAVTVAAVADTAVDVSWTYTGAFQTGFEVERQVGAGTFTKVATPGSAVRTYRDTVALIVGQSYTYRMRTISKISQSTYAVAAAMSPTFTAPTAVTVAAVADTAADVSWTYTGAFQTGFEVERQVGTGTFTKVGTAGSAVRTYRDTVALIAGQSYTYRVRAISKNNQSTYAVAAAMSPTFTAPAAVTVAAVSDTAADVNWTYTGAFQTGFEVERQIGADAFTRVMTLGPSTRSWRDTLQLADGVSYSWRVRAVSKYNQSSYGSAPTFSASLAAPSSLTVTLTTIQASLTWTDNSNIERGFSIEQSSDGTNFAPVATAPANAVSCTLNGSFTVRTTYYFRVRAHASVNGPYSNVAAAAPPPLGMVAVAGGTFQMGSTTGSTDELPVHSVTVGSFNMDMYEVTYEKWTAVRSWGATHGYTDLPPETGTTGYPVANASGYDIVKWCNARSEMDGLAPVYYTDASQSTVYKTGTIVLVNGAVKLTAHGYRLPTEAEWEFAARGGTQTHGYTYSGSNDINTVAWYSTNSGTSTHPVGGLAANELGLYDMSGNVWESCWDWYGGYSSSAQTNPQGPTSGTYRVLRGGSYADVAVYCQVSNRDYGAPGAWGINFGFRCVED